MLQPYADLPSTSGLNTDTPTLKDILTVPEQEIPSTRVLYTIVGGQVAYEGK